jgi:hypothetical protein
MVLFRKTSKQDALKAGVVSLCHGSSHSRCGPCRAGCSSSCIKAARTHWSGDHKFTNYEISIEKVESAFLTAITILKNAAGRFVVSATKSLLPKKFAEFLWMIRIRLVHFNVLNPHQETRISFPATTEQV